MRAFLVGTVLGAVLVAAAPASAQTQFGFLTTQVAPNYQPTCVSGIPTQRYGVLVAGAPPFLIGSSGFPSCTWTSVGTTSSLIAPGTGTVTSVQLPALQNPGPMQVVVLRFSRINGANPGLPTLVCCQAVAFSQVFTPTPGQPTNLQTNLPVGAGPVTAVPGESQDGDALGLSILSPNAQLPVVDTGDDNSPFGSYIWLPALNGSTQEFVQPGDATGYILEMSATWMPAATPTGNVGDGANNGTTGGGGGGGGGGAGGGGGGGNVPGANVTTPAGGLRLATPGAVSSSGLLGLGTAANPPTASTRQTLKAGKVTVGSGTTRIGDGRSGKLTARLNSAGKKLLKKKGKLKVKLTIVAKNSAGASQTVTKTITLKKKR